MAGILGWGCETSFQEGIWHGDDGCAGPTLSPPGQAGKGRQLLYAPVSASFPETRSALETKLLIRSHSASCCHFHFQPRKPSALSARPSAPFTQMQMSPGPLWLASFPLALETAAIRLQQTPRKGESFQQR